MKRTVSVKLAGVATAALGLAAGSFPTLMPAHAGLWEAVTQPVRDISNAAAKAAQDAANATAKAAQDAQNATEKAAQDARNAAAKAAEDAATATAKAAQDAQNAAEKAAQDGGKAVEKAAQDTGHAIEKAIQDGGKTAEKAVQDGGTAVEAIGQFVEHELKGVGQTLNDAEKRVREGKIVDAIWHMSTDPAKHTEKNAFAATQKSNVLGTAAQLAATAYGGPAGAAAYAAWSTYRITGSFETALRFAVISGISSAVGAAGKLPLDTTLEIAQQAVITGAVDGAAVAAAGGNAEAIKDGFLRSGLASVAGNLPVDSAQMTKLPSEGPARKALVTAAIGGIVVAVAGGNTDAIKDGFLRSGGMVLIQSGYEKVADGLPKLGFGQF
jgi:hypothetical protein